MKRQKYDIDPSMKRMNAVIEHRVDKGEQNVVYSVTSCEAELREESFHSLIIPSKKPNWFSEFHSDFSLRGGSSFGEFEVVS